jgi:hypothetical protein
MQEIRHSSVAVIDDGRADVPMDMMTPGRNMIIWLWRAAGEYGLERPRCQGPLWVFMTVMVIQRSTLEYAVGCTACGRQLEAGYRSACRNRAGR